MSVKETYYFHYKNILILVTEITTEWIYVQKDDGLSITQNDLTRNHLCIRSDI